MAEEKTAVEVPAKFQGLVESIEKLSALELSELVKVLEGKFGVSAAPPAVMSGTTASSEASVKEEEKTDFTIELAEAGPNKIAVIKVVREITGKGLKDAKDLVDGAPKAIKENVPKAEALELQKKLEDAGAKVNLK
ncbi:MAG: 50S ribosomal protein L7/L12 [Candidatus Doudnabacteria bacterium]|nr:50S ribosomal protein L7/L12 [Candidatus Doudnabacteria bacterium]